MKRIDLIKTMDTETFADFILNFHKEKIRKVMCKKCKHRVINEQGKSYCELSDDEPCDYSDKDMFRDWLEMEI